MPTYATQQDFIDAFGEREVIMLTNLYAPTATAINTAKLIQCQEDAKALIDGMISTCPTVAAQMPFTVIPPLLRTFELAICRYMMDSVQAREDVRKRYEDAMKQLLLIGQCKMSLGLSGADPAVAIPTVSLDGAIGSKTNYFGGCALNGY
jgi:phage gp36-like protein